MKKLFLFLLLILSANFSFCQFVRFKVDVRSVGKYDVSGKSYYIDYLDSNDTSRTSKQASYIEKALNLQGAKRTFEKNGADFTVNFSFNRDREGRTIYRDIKKHSIYGAKTKEEYDSYLSESNRSSRTDPGMPYYRQASRPIERQTYSQRINSSIHYFSLIIEGISQKGDILWTTIVTDIRSAAISDAITPYLCFAAIGYFGVEADISEQFPNNDPLYLEWAEGLLNSSNVVLYPECNASSKKVTVAAIVKKDNKTAIVLKDSHPKFFNKSDAYLEHNGQKIPASGSYLDEKRLPINSYSAFTIWEFPVNSNNLEEFDLVFYSEKGKEKLAIRKISMAK